MKSDIFENYNYSRNVLLSDDYTCSNELTPASLYLKQIRYIKVLNSEEEKELAYKIREGDIDAKNKLVEHNLRLVANAARKFINKGLPYLDLVQEGNIGLIDAIDRYDVSKGFRFSTYATYWINSYIVTALMNKSRAIRLPQSIIRKSFEYYRVKKELSNKLLREATIEEVACEMNINVEYSKLCAMCLDEMISLDYLVDEEHDTEVINCVKYDDCNFENEIIDSFMYDELYEVIDSADLTEMEHNLLNLRFGLNDCKCETLEVIGERYGFCRERARQLIERVLDKIRTNEKTMDLIEYANSPTRALEKINKSNKHKIKRRI